MWSMALRNGYSAAPQGGGGFNPYSAGKKRYGSGRPMPTVGKVTDKAGYNERDAKMKARKEALIRRASSRPGRAV
jgi:hypothetical protein